MLMVASWEMDTGVSRIFQLVLCKFSNSIKESRKVITVLNHLCSFLKGAQMIFKIYY